MQLKIGSKTDVGLLRKENEDSMSFFEDGDFSVIVVCDGMGGHVGGQIASSIACKTIKLAFLQSDSKNPKEKITFAVSKANKEIFSTAQEKKELTGMGTTCVLLCYNKKTNNIFIGHVGDSRCYLLSKNGDFKQITKDHSRVQEMVDAGWITEEEAEQSDKKNIITRALGLQPEIDVEITGPIVPRNGDRFLLCSDGLSDMVSDDNIANIIIENKKTQIAAEKLVEKANQNGGKDNISVCVLLFNGKKKCNMIKYLLLILILCGTIAVLNYYKVDFVVNAIDKICGLIDEKLIKFIK